MRRSLAANMERAPRLRRLKTRIVWLQIALQAPGAVKVQRRRACAMTRALLALKVQPSL
jgi:hypothetical protein